MSIFSKKDKKQLSPKEILQKIEELNKKISGVFDAIELLKKENKFSIKKLAIVRYNPFSGVGGNQSFSIALLDANNDGAIITSLFSADSNRVYAKPVKGGRSEYTLSDEEQKAVKDAMLDRKQYEKK